ncbi:DapH/DapD/GlmU-related protein [Pseudarthrobacter oxydans]|uniref:DapH/DapD/GlmU-related protein n=2 Tax=Pseudarthrobacter oxydans TaxID=1671 RepID=UPI00381E1035
MPDYKNGFVRGRGAQFVLAFRDSNDLAPNIVGMGTFAKLWPGLGRDLILNTVIASSAFPRPLRWGALRAYGLKVEKSRISPGVWFGSHRVTIGAGTFINYGCMFNTSAPVTIGRNCDIGMRVTFVTSSHRIGSRERRAGAATSAPITVGDGVWIGAAAVVLPGVTIGEGVIVAAGAVVTSDCAPNGVYAGVPARRVKELHAVL